MGDRVVVRARDLDDPVVLHVEREVAAHAAVGADRVGVASGATRPTCRLRACRTRCVTSARRSGTRRCSCRSTRTPSRAAARRTRWRCGRRSRARRRRWRTCSATARRTRRRTCSRGCTSRSRARRGRCRPSPARGRSQPSGHQVARGERCACGRAQDPAVPAARSAPGARRTGAGSSARRTRSRGRPTRRAARAPACG